jgi:tRNA A-37 threonylcarbamoyl transferase component Bud32
MARVTGWSTLRVAGLELCHDPQIPAEIVGEAIARHRANAALGRDACEHWGPASSVSRVELTAGDGARFDLAVKWNHPRGLRRALVEGLRGSRAARATRGAEELARIGIASPEVRAIAENRRAGGVRESFLLTDFLADALPLPVAMPTLCEDRLRRRAAAHELGDLIGKLHAAGFDHGDLKHSNLLLQADGCFALLDLDSMIPPRRPGLRQRARALGQLEAYAVDLYPWLPRTDRARFFASYLEHDDALRRQRRELAKRATRWAARRLASWSRRDRSDHYHYPLAPRGAPGRGS